MGILFKKEPQIKAPRVTPLEGVSTSTVTPVDCVHTYASALAYVDARPQGAQPLTYACGHTWARSRESAGFRYDEHRFMDCGNQFHSMQLRFGTRMTRIRRIFTDPCVSVSSAQSVFYRRISAFICVHLRLISVSIEHLSSRGDAI
jgi:hypothetical protein